ncbi:polysaccharide deacetylase family protein [Paenisporosarcina sp. OV554]|uniref:polysaccharide deacetylase family protein n=1 Tax=Paenisporosarcina sp. OV554 TaxID=2135694 RepID=UPI000D3D14FE|nr:polysaccharide deacetylase family protein [Paenisporosarcina sp. OV554]
MKYTKLMTLTLLALMLAACGKEETKTPASAPAQEEVDEKIENEETNEELVTDVVEEEPMEEVTTKPLYKLNEANWAFKPIADAPSKVVLLTIDDAPDKRSLEMAKTLKELNAPAIFFVNGHFLDTDEEKAVLKEIHAMGFAIGNHTQTHANLKDLTEEQQRAEIMQVSEKVEAIIGEKPKYFRAPFGSNTDFSKALVKEQGMLLMNWTYGYDWVSEYQDAKALTGIMVNSEFLTNGANLLMHDRVWTAAALKGIVEGLRGKGYEMIDPATIQGVTAE